MVEGLMPNNRLNYLNLIVRGIIIGVAYSLLIVIFQQAFMFLKTDTTPLDPLVTFVLLSIGGVPLALVLGFVALHFKFPLPIRYLLVFMILYCIGYVLNIIEYIFFSDVLIHQLYYEITVMTLTHIIIAFLIIMLYPANESTSSLVSVIKSFFNGRPTQWWVVRIFLAGIAYLVIYLIFGMIVSPFVLPYYTDPSYGLNLKLPGFDVIIPLEIIRGMIYAILLIPIIATSTLKKWRLVLLLASVLLFVGAFPGLVGNQLWPIELRLAHGLEITADSFFQSLAFLKLFKKFEA